MGIVTSERLLKPKYDAIVIGAGLGGLTTASLLGKRGADVLLVEQTSLPGGACTSFRREGRIYDCGAALVFGFGKEGYHLHRYLVNFLEEPITVIPRDKFFRLDFAGQQIIVWKELSKFLAELEKRFPEEKTEIRDLYAFLTGFYDKYIKGKDLLTPPSEISNADKLKMVLSSPRRVGQLRKLLSQSATDLMGPYLKSRKLLEFYDKLCASYAYITMKETPAVMALTTFVDNHAGGTCYVAGSAQTYANTLERSIERNGGTVLYRQRVERILFEKNRAYAVKLMDGTVIKADRIVSDTTVWNLYFNLIPREHVTESQRRWAKSLVPTYPAMVLHASVDKAVFPPDINPVEYYVSDTSQIDMGDITLYIPTVDDETLGPKDEHIVTIFSPAPNQKWPRPFEKEYQSPAYHKQKERQASLILDQIERRIPNFRKGIRKLYIASPSTVERYTLKNGGCMGGPKQMIGQELTKRLHAKTAWPGLYACGDSTTMGMGTPAVIASGFGAANVILRELGKPEYRIKTFDREYVTYIKRNPRKTTPKTVQDKPANARLIARECQQCEAQPCRAACPANIDIAGFIRRIEVGNFAGAARLIRDTNPLAEVCGHICPADRLCERVCIRKKYAAEPVQIRELHRWVAKLAGKEGWSKPVTSPNGKSVCVIGTGPEGLTCAHYLARLGYRVDLYDETSQVGDRLKELVRNQSLPKDAYSREMASFFQPLMTFNGRWKLASKTQLDELRSKYDAVYLASKADGLQAKSGFVKNMPNVFAEATTTKDAKHPYEIVHAVRDGRQAAMALHTLLAKQDKR